MYEILLQKAKEIAQRYLLSPDRVNDYEIAEAISISSSVSTECNDKEIVERANALLETFGGGTMF